jgi:hypothetical protein
MNQWARHCSYCNILHTFNGDVCQFQFLGKDWKHTPSTHILVFLRITALKGRSETDFTAYAGYELEEF